MMERKVLTARQLPTLPWRVLKLQKRRPFSQQQQQLQLPHQQQHQRHLQQKL